LCQKQTWLAPRHIDQQVIHPLTYRDEIQRIDVMAFELTYRPLEDGSNKIYLHRSLENPSLLIPEKEIGCFLVLQSSYALHETIGLSAQNLNISWQANQDYLSSNCAGVAPLACYPIYLITVGDGENENLVYIGKISSKSSRFSSGHSAITKLHHPKYDKLSKRIYLCCVVFLKNSQTIPIEWIKPFDFAEKLLSDFEANLIYWNKPELNTQHINKEPTFEYGQVHAQNVTGATYFWHDKFI
ncbi:hypothetical protein, partial [Morganella morganii]|uniref:hypothetical protein n=1 Tax=Morganella morganii TaxID=582 RepID=UPI002023ACDF